MMRPWAAIACAGIALTSLGCDSALYGVGTFYFWNGTEHPVELRIDGQTIATLPGVESQPRTQT